VSPKNENFQILELKSSMSIGQRVYLWNYETFLNIKYGFIKLSAVKDSKRNLKTVTKRLNFSNFKT